METAIYLSSLWVFMTSARPVSKTQIHTSYQEIQIPSKAESAQWNKSYTFRCPSTSSISFSCIKLTLHITGSEEPLRVSVTRSNLVNPKTSEALEPSESMMPWKLIPFWWTPPQNTKGWIAITWMPTKCLHSLLWVDEFSQNGTDKVIGKPWCHSGLVNFGPDTKVATGSGADLKHEP